MGDQDWDVRYSDDLGYRVCLVKSTIGHFRPYIVTADADWNFKLSLSPDAESGTVSPSFAGKETAGDRLVGYTHETYIECMPDGLTVTDSGELCVEAPPRYLQPGDGRPADPFNFRLGFKVQLPPESVAAVRFAISEAFKLAATNPV